MSNSAEEEVPPLVGGLQVFVIAVDRDEVIRALADLPSNCAIVVLAGSLDEGVVGASEAGALLYQTVRVVAAP